MSFDPCNRPLEIQESIETSTPKMRAHLGVWGFIPSHFSKLLGTWNVIPRFHSWHAPSQALALVTSPRLRLQHKRFIKKIHEPKVLVFKCIMCWWTHAFINVFGININPNVWSTLEKWDPQHMLNNESWNLNIQNLSIMPFGTSKKIWVGIT
jgi:hypothetical protein